MAFEFDKFNEEDCAPGANTNNGSIDSTTCKPVPGSTPGGTDDIPPSDDDRCADPAFYDANPEICAGYPRLILKPEYALTESGKTVQYKTYLRTSGNEQQLTSGLVYSISNSDIAVIHANSGLATGVSTGITTVSVSWQNLNAFAQLEVVESCNEEESNFILLLDDSKSMTVGFSGIYASKLSFSKEAAHEFIDSVNFSKDQVSVLRFDSSGVIVQNFTSSSDSAKSAVSAITATTFKTDLHAGLKKAIDHHTANSVAKTKVIVLFSDGENNTGDDPILLANSFKDAGGIIIVIATRAWGVYFDTLYKISSSGFFLSAYEATSQNVIETLAGLKSFICSGDCQPLPGTYPMAQLNYYDFINWDVFQGSVDLVGLGLWDLLPGNGLYVDLAGTRDFTNSIFPSPGGIRSKTVFDFIAGHQYRLRINVAGNNRQATEDDEAVRVSIGTLLDELINPASWDSPFVTSEFLFTPGVDESAQIQIEMIQEKDNNVGPMIDVVVLEDVTDSDVMLNDNFDTENPTTIPFTYSHYSCLSTPPGAQSADPIPPTPPLSEE